MNLGAFSLKNVRLLRDERVRVELCIILGLDPIPMQLELHHTLLLHTDTQWTVCGEFRPKLSVLKLLPLLKHCAACAVAAAACSDENSQLRQRCFFFGALTSRRNSGYC